MTKSTFTVSLASSESSFSAEFSLTTGAGKASWRGSPGGGWVPHQRTIVRTLVLDPLTPDELETFRARADEMRDRGQHRYRDQFAQSGVGFVLDDGDGTTIEWEFHLDGGLPLNDDDVYSVAAQRVRAARDAQCAAELARGSVLPAVDSDESLMPLHRETEPWLAATESVAHKHRLKSDGWVRASDGSQIVMLGDDAVIKFYVPWWPPIVDIEESTLALLRSELSFDVPRVVARGRLDGWEYLGITRVAGTPLRDVDDLSDAESRAIAHALGASIRELHDIEVPKDSTLRDVVPRWRSFLTEHRNRRRELEIERGTSEEWTERLVKHLQSWRYRKRPTDTLLHADLTHDHIMLKQVDGQWTFSGLIDFGDAKVGDRAYDFAAPFAFLTADRPDLRRAMLDGYGAGEELLDRIFESLLLHEFGRLAALELDGLETIDDVRRRYVALSH